MPRVGHPLAVVLSVLTGQAGERVRAVLERAADLDLRADGDAGQARLQAGRHGAGEAGDRDRAGRDGADEPARLAPLLHDGLRLAAARRDLDGAAPGRAAELAVREAAGRAEVRRDVGDEAGRRLVRLPLG